jgi:hypothetical protein
LQTVSFHFISFHFISFHFISFHFISSLQTLHATVATMQRKDFPITRNLPLCQLHASRIIRDYTEHGLARPELLAGWQAEAEAALTKFARPNGLGGGEKRLQLSELFKIIITCRDE